MSAKACTHLQQVNQNIKAKTPTVVKNASKWVLTGYICVYVYHVVMWDVMILLPISMVLGTLGQQLILLSNHTNQVKTGNGVMLIRDLWSDNKDIL
jgi:hypothetical protein